jgi:hypothetical protein
VLSIPRVMTCGVVFIHATSSALCPHIVWALESVLGESVALDWTRQPLGPKMLRAEVVSALRGWDNLRFEVTEEPSPGSDGSRWSHTPSLGIHHAWTSASGDAVINEDRLRAAISASHGDPARLTRELDRLLGRDWDDELEPFRRAGDGANVRWLHMVG